MNTLRDESVKTSDGVRIVFDHYRRGFHRLVIVAPGFYNSKDAVLLKALAEELVQDADVLVLDFRGHGRSDGLFYWSAKEYLDLLAVLHYAGGLYEKIGVIGFSLGAATAIISCVKTDLIDSVIAISSPMEFEKIEYKFWELDFATDIKYSLLGEGRIGKGVRPGPFWLPKEKPIEVVKKIKQPVLYLHGSDDWVIKPWHSQVLYDQTVSLKELKIIENGPHAEYLILKCRHILEPAIKDWFKKTL